MSFKKTPFEKFSLMTQSYVYDLAKGKRLNSLGKKLNMLSLKSKVFKCVKFKIIIKKHKNS